VTNVARKTYVGLPAALKVWQELWELLYFILHLIGSYKFLQLYLGAVKHNKFTSINQLAIPIMSWTITRSYQLFIWLLLLRFSYFSWFNGRVNNIKYKHVASHSCNDKTSYQTRQC